MAMMIMMRNMTGKSTKKKNSNRLAQRPSEILKKARNKYVRENPITMEEIDKEIEKYRSGEM